MILFHWTTKQEARRIVTHGGFKSATRQHISSGMFFTGVYVSTVPFEFRTGDRGNALIEIYLDATESEIEEFEILTEGSRYRPRKWCVPAELLNTRGSFRVVRKRRDFSH